MADLHDLATSMARLARHIREAVPEVKRKIAADALRLVIFATPVGNKTIWQEPGKAATGYVGGRARNNWYVGIGAAPVTVTEEVDASGGQRLSEGMSTIKSTPPEASIYIVNNLPYIEPLNSGHSHQAPSGFIDQAVQRAASNAENYKPIGTI